MVPHLQGWSARIHT